MKKWIYSIVSILIFSQSLTAMTIGPEGESYEENNIVWQPVQYENDDTGFSAALPGDPQSGIADGNAYCYSKYDHVHYQIHTMLNGYYQPPSNQKKFLKQIEEALGSVAIIQPVDSQLKNVEYVVDLYWFDTERVTRVFCSSNQLYWANVQGPDLTLAPLFFDKIRITK